MIRKEEYAPQTDLFSTLDQGDREEALLKTQQLLHRRFGKNAVFRGNDLYEAATTIERNGQIGGHRK